MNISEIMTSRIVTVGMDDSLRIVKEIFDNVQFHHLLVVDAEELVGIVSDRDLLKALSPYAGTLAETSRDAETLARKVHQVMTRAPVTLQDTADVTDAVEVFNFKRISCIPVIDKYRAPVGIVSWRDVMKWLGQTLPPGTHTAITYDLTGASTKV